MYNIELLDKIIQSNKINEESKVFRMKKLKAFQEQAYPVWQRIKVNDTAVPDYKPYNNQKVLWHKQHGLSIKPVYHYSGDYFDEKISREYGPSKKHKSLAEAFSNTGSFIEVQPNVRVDDPIVIQLEMTNDNNLILDHHIIHAGAMAEVTVVLDYSDSSDGGYQNGIINIIADQGAQVHLVKIQNFGKASTHISSGISAIEQEASVRFSGIDLGSGLVVTDYSTYLDGENAKSTVESVYLGDGESKLDLGYNINHSGRRTESDILVKGALLDEARKVFRGNLFFERGARRAKGSEEEYVILLDERVKSDSIPALMCNEDDVQGEHAASAGQIDEGKLFYLMSRGLTEKEAKQLIIMASFAPVIEEIPIAGLRDRIGEEVNRRLTQDL